MSIVYEHARSITPDEFVDVLQRSTLGERRPLHDRDAIRAMLEHANLLCTAWKGDHLVGVARSLTDFQYCCYLADLAVDAAYQRQGLGQELLRLTQSRLGPHAKIVLLSAPKAVTYYPRLGLEPHPSAWTLGARAELR